MTNEQKIWNFFKSKGLNDYACAGLMGNLSAESNLNPHNLQNTYERSLGFTDDEYVHAIDNGTYTKDQFVYDQAGAFLAQWTYWSRKKALYEYAKSKGTSIGDLTMQLEFLYQELSTSYKGVLSTLKNATSILEASNAVLLDFERPADQSVAVQQKRESFGKKYYDKYATSSKGDDGAMGVKTYQESARTQLSKNFNSYEFRCGLGTPCSCSTVLVDSKLVEYLQQIRDYFGKTVTITSAYRCPTYNKSVSKATSSYHTKGMAADIVVSGVAPKEVAKYAESIGVLGIGLYETGADGYFTHIDTRTTKSFWYGQAQFPRTTFGGSNSNTSNNSTPSTTILSNGSRGEAVKELQEKLNSLGYSCGIADGEYGAKTAKAVREFQGKNGLTEDGIAGQKTLAAINKAISSNSKKVKVTANVLNIRAGAGTNYAINGTTKKGSVHEILEEKEGWGKINNGWISLEYTEKA